MFKLTLGLLPFAMIACSGVAGLTGHVDHVPTWWIAAGVWMLVARFAGNKA